MSYRFADSLRAGSDDGQRKCPKHIEFNSKNKFEKLVQLVSFNVRVYRDARSPEFKKKNIITAWYNIR